MQQPNERVQSSKLLAMGMKDCEEFIVKCLAMYSISITQHIIELIRSNRIFLLSMHAHDLIVKRVAETATGIFFIQMGLN